MYTNIRFHLLLGFIVVLLTLSQVERLESFSAWLFPANNDSKSFRSDSLELGPKGIDYAGFNFNHTMIRIKDPKISVPFYEKNFGMKVLGHVKKTKGFDVYYLGIEATQPEDTAWYERDGLLGLIHNYGTENNDSYTINNGNNEPYRGYGHIGFSLENIEATCERLEADGVKFQKKLSDGRMKDIAFALDPDGYWIELISNPIKTSSKPDNVKSYKFNHSMVRVKDAKKSIDFYTHVLGMTLIRKNDHPRGKFTTIFLGYNHPKSQLGISGDREGVIELTHNWGTEEDAEFQYHNGNDEPQGFGCWGITVPDVVRSMEEFEKAGVVIKKKAAGDSLNGVILDPDGYWVEILPAAGDFETK